MEVIFPLIIQEREAKLRCGGIDKEILTSLCARIPVIKTTENSRE